MEPLQPIWASLDSDFVKSRPSEGAVAQMKYDVIAHSLVA